MYTDVSLEPVVGSSEMSPSYTTTHTGRNEHHPRTYVYDRCTNDKFRHSLPPRYIYTLSIPVQREPLTQSIKNDRKKRHHDTVQYGVKSLSFALVIEVPTDIFDVILTVHHR